MRQALKHIGTGLGHLPFSFGHTGIKVEVLDLIHPFDFLLYDFKKALVVFTVFGVVGLSKKLIGDIANLAP